MSASLYFIQASNHDNWLGSEINMSNRNASLVISALGGDPNFWDAPRGSTAELISACELYLNSEIASVIDNGIATKVTPPDDQYGIGTGCTMIECGIRPGYISDRVREILSEARENLAEGRDEYYWC